MGLLGDLASAVGHGLDLFKAEVEVPGIDEVRGPGGPMVADPFVWALSSAAYREKPSRVGYETLRYLCHRDSILSAIFFTRIGQLMPFSRPNLDEDSEMATGRANGFRVRLKKGAGERQDATKQREEAMTKFIQNCSREDVPHREKHERGFASFLKKFVRDRLELDQPCGFIELDRIGSPRQFYAIDGATVRVVDPAKSQEYDYVQVYQGKVVTRFRDEEFMFCPENITTAMKQNGYGESEAEIAMRMVQAHLGIDETNSRQFQPGSMPKGMLTLTGADINEQQLRSLEARYKAQVATFRGKHKLPLLPISRGGRIDFIHFPQATDIEFGAFLDYIVNLCSALYRIDPVEINFPNRSGGIGGGGNMINSAPEATRLTASRDKGLRTLVDFIEDCMNQELMPVLDPQGEFEFQFTGFDRQSESDRMTLDREKSSVYMTINEVREAHGMEPIEHGDIIRDPSFMQEKQGAMGEQGADGEDDTDAAEAGGDWDSQWPSGEGDLF